jgi:hypothetical protein
VWKMLPLCLLLNLFREMNNKSFEDSERIFLFFNTLYLWTFFFFFFFALGD